MISTAESFRMFFKLSSPLWAEEIGNGKPRQPLLLQRKDWSNTQGNAPMCCAYCLHTPTQMPAHVNQTVTFIPESNNHRQKSTTLYYHTASQIMKQKSIIQNNVHHHLSRLVASISVACQTSFWKRATAKSNPYICMTNLPNMLGVLLGHLIHYVRNLHFLTKLWCCDDSLCFFERKKRWTDIGWVRGWTEPSWRISDANPDMFWCMRRFIGF